MPVYQTENVFTVVPLPASLDWNVGGELMPTRVTKKLREEVFAEHGPDTPDPLDLKSRWVSLWTNVAGVGEVKVLERCKAEFVGQASRTLRDSVTMVIAR